MPSPNSRPRLRKRCQGHHDGRAEGVDMRTKRIMRQMRGRAGFDLLPQRIRCAADHSVPPPIAGHARIGAHVIR
ncbi:hypothetical protein FLX08_23860 [Microbispora hainanensis]|uniref:Uncharacterized protein n=1 Tax=Microbispora hainanensis TaxID=568844 RepID=A0A544YP85_9ACTN|nr:hypothetical protein FLX08_23860 [Microbispora hainanensis]